MDGFVRLGSISGGIEPIANKIKAAMDDVPLRSDSREELCVWMCEMHNRVKEQEGKAPYNCEYSNLKKRWGPP